MRVWGLLLVALAFVCACGDARSASNACDELCSMPECFAQLGVPVPGGDCMQACQAQIDVVGLDCVYAISDTIACLPTCDVNSLTNAQLLACQDEALRIDQACD